MAVGDRYVLYRISWAIYCGVSFGLALVLQEMPDADSAVFAGSVQPTKRASLLVPPISCRWLTEHAFRMLTEHHADCQSNMRSVAV